ncbi:type I-G CRISPR-associated protein Csb2 [Nitrospirillum amazonense]|nr:type I-U CRISPR-associated protein Csb2 [Nitrospirillum amazonense]
MAASRPLSRDRLTVLRAVRAALMSLARTADGGVLPLFSGHGEGPGPARPGDHRHVYIAALDDDGDGRLDQILVMAPWRVDRGVAPTDDNRADFARVTGRLALVRAGAAGVLTLAPPLPLPGERGRVWLSRTPYRPTRHPAKGADAATFVVEDVRRECARRGLPAPSGAQPLMIRPGPRGGLSARLCLSFTEPVAGPLLLGRDAHRGGGLFSASVPLD